MELHRPGEFARSFVNRMLVAVAVVACLSVPLVLWLGLPALAGPTLVVLVIGVGYRADVVDTLNWHRGARGEEAVGHALGALESRGFRSLHDLDMGRGNVDHVVAGPTGVFAIETKAWRRAVYCGKGGRLMAGSFDQERAVAQVKREARHVRDRLVAAGLGRWVSPVIVLTATSLPKGPITRGPVTVIELSDLERFLVDRPASLSALDVSRAIAAIFRNGMPVVALDGRVGG